MFYRWLLWSSVSFFAIIIVIATKKVLFFLLKVLSFLLEKCSKKKGRMPISITLALEGLSILSIPLALGVAQNMIFTIYHPGKYTWLHNTIVGIIISPFVIVVLTLMALFVAKYILKTKPRDVDFLESFIVLTLHGTLFSTCVGISQWLTLRSSVQYAIWWVPATAISAAIGIATSIVVLLHTKESNWKSETSGAAIYAVLSGLAFALLIGQ